MTRTNAMIANEPFVRGRRGRRPQSVSAAAVTLALSLAPLTAIADSFNFFENGFDNDGKVLEKYLPLQNVLQTFGLDDRDDGFETDGQSFIVPDGNGSSVSITASLIQDTGSYNFTFGAFPVEAVAGMDAPQDRFGWTTAALTNPQTMVVFDDRFVNPCSNISVLDSSCQQSFGGIPVGSEWFFFVIPNNTLKAYTDDPAAYWNGTIDCGYEDSKCAKPLFSYTPANPGSFDQMLSFIGNGETLFSFEDKSRAADSDADFSDLVFLLDFEDSDDTFIADDSQGMRETADVSAPTSLWLVLTGLLAAVFVRLLRAARRR